MSDLARGGCPGGSSRRVFLKAAAASGAIGTLASLETAVADGPKPAESAVPHGTLGRTGEKVTILGMGTSWALSPSFVQAALFSGVRYIDTSETYENTRAEKVLGDVLDRTGDAEGRLPRHQERRLPQERWAPARGRCSSST